MISPVLSCWRYLKRGSTGIIIRNRGVVIRKKYLVAGVAIFGEECCLKTLLFYSYHTLLMARPVLSLLKENEGREMKLKFCWSLKHE